MIGKKEYHVMNEETEKEVEINRQFTKEIAFQMFLNGKLDGVLESDWVNIAKEMTIQWGQERYGNEDIKLEFNKLFTLNHFAFNNADAVEFAHKTVGEYFTAVKLYEDYFERVFNKLDENIFEEISTNVITEVWQSIFNAFRYKKVPMDIMSFLSNIMESRLDVNWKSNFFQAYYVGINEQLLVAAANKKSDYLTENIAWMHQIQLSFRNLTWLLFCLGFDNSRFDNTKENLEILSSYIKGDVNLSGWKNLNNIDLSASNLRRACFNYSCLSDAKFNRADLDEATFIGATIRCSDFRYASLIRSSFEKVKCVDVRFERAHLEQSQFNTATLILARFDKAYLNESNFKKAYFQCTHLRDAYCEAVKLDQASLEWSILNGSNFTNAVFTNTTFKNTRFVETCLKGASFHEAILRRASFKKAILDNAVFFGTNLEEAEWSNSSQKETKFICVYLLESDLPKFDKYIENEEIIFTGPIITNCNAEKVYNPETNRMEIKGG